MSVLVDGVKPVKCVTRLISRPAIVLHSYKWSKDDNTGEEEHLEDCEVVCESLDCFRNINNEEPCSLLKAVLLVLRVVDPQSAVSESLSHRLLRLFGSVGIEVACVSRLPAGSGMGGSSILAAAVLRSLMDTLRASAGATGREMEEQEEESDSSLLYLVSQVEQVLTTGGGWQDQMGAMRGGFKVGRSLPSLPLRVEVSRVRPSREFISVFERRVCLVFTGQQRLARNTLINALRKCALTPRRGCSGSAVRTSDANSSTVSELVKGAEKGHRLLNEGFNCAEDQNSERMEGLLDQLAEVVNE